MIAMWTPGLIELLLIGGFVAFIIFSINLFKKNPKLGAIILIIPAALILLAILIPVIRRVRVPEIRNRVVPPIVNARVSSDYPSSDNSPIWSEGIENEFEADVYPSKEAAVRSIALKLRKELRNIISSPDQLEAIVIDNSQDIELLEHLKDAIFKQYPAIKCRIENNYGSNVINQVRIRLDLTKRSTMGNVVSGTYRATLSGDIGSTNISVDFTEKPWVENFSSFVNSQPGKNYIIAKSNETCMSSNEAGQQAMQNVLSKIIPMIHYSDPKKLQYNDIQRSGMIVDKFVQSFDTSTGKIWREAILLDVSQEKFTQLANIISNTGREETMNWARMFLSIVGLFILIVIAYAFLNAATKGYYSITLKIVGIILAAIFLLIILTLT